VVSTGHTFAKHAGMSPAAVSHLLNGRVANPRTICKVASALARIPPLFGLEDMLELVPRPDDVQQRKRAASRA
jgi:transcriptional regulator with XRE-family HTH domain